MLEFVSLTCSINVKERTSTDKAKSRTCKSLLLISDDQRSATVPARPLFSTFWLDLDRTA